MKRKQITTIDDAKADTNDQSPPSKKMNVFSNYDVEICEKNGDAVTTDLDKVKLFHLDGDIKFHGNPNHTSTAEVVCEITCSPIHRHDIDNKKHLVIKGQDLADLLIENRYYALTLQEKDNPYIKKIKKLRERKRKSEEKFLVEVEELKSELFIHENGCHQDFLSSQLTAFEYCKKNGLF